MKRRSVESGLSAFSETLDELARQVREAALDHEVFEMPLKICELTKCRASCCHDGVFLSTEEKETIEALLPTLGKYGGSRSPAFETRGGKAKTRTVDASPTELADDFPTHFPRTRCVFLDEQHRCVLQRLAVDDGRRPWFWKPVSCWMHPLLLRRGADGRPVLTLARPGNDPAEQPGYPGFEPFTPCGMERADGSPARETLRAELEMLGKLAGRNLIGELWISPVPSPGCS